LVDKWTQALARIQEPTPPKEDRLEQVAKELGYEEEHEAEQASTPESPVSS